MLVLDPPCAIYDIREAPAYETFAGSTNGPMGSDWSSMVALSPWATAQDPWSLASAKLDSQRQKAILELERYGNFPRGWDGYHGRTFSPRVVATATWLTEYIVDYLGREGVFPTLLAPGPAPDGSIDLEVRRADRSLIFTLYGDEPEIGVWRGDASQSAESVVDFSPAVVAEQLAWLAD